MSPQRRNLRPPSLSGITATSIQQVDGAVGLITDPHHAEAILQSGDADLVALARGIMSDADWPAHAAAALKLLDAYDVFPPDYAYRFRGRDRSRGGYGTNRNVTIPHGIGDERPYDWPLQSAPRA